MRRKTLEERQSLRKFLKGMLLVPVLGILWLFVIYGAALLIEMMKWYGSYQSLLVLAVFGIGIAQIIYLLPLGLYLQSKDHNEYVKGLITGGAIVALLNGGCWIGAQITQFSDYGLFSLAATLAIGLLAFILTLVVLLFNLK